MHNSSFVNLSHRILGRFLLLILAAVLLAPDRAVAVDSANPVQLTLESAVRFATEADPQFQVYAAGLEASAAEVEQADVRPNPVVGLEVENFAGTGALSGVDGAEITLGLRQTIETAGKREKRVALTRALGESIRTERAERFAVVTSAVRREFVSALLAREAVQLQETYLDLLEQNERATAVIVEAARAPQVDLSRARLTVKQQQFALDRSRRMYGASKARLAALLGPSAPVDFDPVGTIALETVLPDFSVLLESLNHTAWLARFDAEAQTRSAVVEVERARARPDFDVFAGARYLNESRGGALVAGIEIPWPLFDKNKGAIRAAEVRLQAVEHRRAAARRDLTIQLTDLYQQMVAAHAEALSAMKDLMPAAEETLAETQDGFERGLFSQLRVIDARETLFNIRTTYFDALTRFSEAQARIESLTMPVTRVQP